MFKEAIKFLVDLTIKPDERFVDVVDANGNKRIFVIDSEGNSKEIKPLISRAQEPLLINTLTGLVDYVKANLEKQNSNFFLQIFNETTVYLKGVLDQDGGRETLVTAKAITPYFSYDTFLNTEQLIISLQSKFTQTNDRDILLKVLGNVKEENVRNTGDNGITQVVTMQTGISTVDDVVVPNPVELAPYRTFLEVEQPISKFIFRMKDGPRGAIFEADGGAWRNQAIENIRDYLTKELADEIKSKKITIIA